MSRDKTKKKTGKAKTSARSRRTPPRDLVARKRQAQAVTGGVTNTVSGTVSVTEKPATGFAMGDGSVKF